MHRVEFTIEPFVAGDPGPHVTATIAAVEALGVDVDVGPFGSSCVTHPDATADVAATIVRTAHAHGATHVNIDVSTEGAP